MHILLVEDNPTNERVARMLLQIMGHTTEWADNGKKALDVIASGKAFDCILMDLAMPVMGGLEATRELIKTYPAPGDRPPVIAVTANAFEQDRKKCTEAGMIDFLPKPLRMDPLRAALINLSRRVTHSSSASSSSGENPGGPDGEREIDKELFCSFVEVDDDESIEIFEDFCSEVPEQIDHMERSFGAKAADEFADLAHQLKGTSSNFGLAGFSNRLGELEQIGMKGDLASVPNNWAQDLRKRFKVAQEQLRSFLVS